jgi:hypothetical protein
LSLTTIQIVAPQLLRNIVLSSIVITLAGCVPSEFIVLKNPETGAIVQCHADSGSSFFPISQTMMDNSASRSCAAGYQAAGWQRMN